MRLELGVIEKSHRRMFLMHCICNKDAYPTAHMAAEIKSVGNWISRHKWCRC